MVFRVLILMWLFLSGCVSFDTDNTFPKTPTEQLFWINSK